MNGFRIRPARATEAETLANTHYALYQRRYFDPNARGPNGEAYGGRYGVQYPQLRPDAQGKGGEEKALFEGYWSGFFDKPKNLCLVAETNEGQMLGFIKGSTGAPPSDVFSAMATRGGQSPRELGSIYIMPQAQRKGVGLGLTAAFAANLAEAGADSMVTRCWAGNDSPQFFQRLGGQMLGDCPIGVEYACYATGQRRVQPFTIDGVMLEWQGERFDQLKQRGQKIMANRNGLGG